jgi:hypothetical protein
MDDTIVRIAKHRELRLQYEYAPNNILPQDEITPEAEQVSDAIHRALSDITWGFIDRPPQTVASVAALMQYVDEYLESGRDWPDNRSYYDAGEETPARICPGCTRW